MLIDSAGRRIEYLRLSVTDRCDLRCSTASRCATNSANGRGQIIRIMASTGG